jgi:lysophospholipase L1-like esterase
MSQAANGKYPKKPRSRVLLIVGIGLFLTLAAVVYNELFLARPIGTGPAGPPVAEEPFQNIWSERPVMVLGIGDSITAGLGARSVEHSYFRRMIDNPADEFDDLQGKNLRRVLPNLQFKNIAVSGSTSLQHVDMIHDRLQTMPEDVYGLVVMTSGGNDIIHNYGHAAARERVSRATA